MKRTLLAALGLLALMGLLCIPGSAVLAQTEPTPVPTITPTPAYLQDVPLSSGNILHIERTITYGDIAVSVAIGLFIVVFALVKSVEIPKRFTQR